MPLMMAAIAPLASWAAASPSRSPDTLEYQNTLVHAYAFAASQPEKAIELYAKTLFARTTTLGP